MATNEEIMDAAGVLGRLIATHEATEQFEAVVKRLEADIEAQRLLNDFNRQMAVIAEKQTNQQPIEVRDKHQLESLKQKVAQHPLIHDFQVAQMNYLDLMRRVDEVMAGQGVGRRGALDRDPVPSADRGSSPSG